jgi:hypothetical protein
VSDKKGGDKSPLIFLLMAYTFERLCFPELKNLPFFKEELKGYTNIFSTFISHTEYKLCDCGTCINYRTQLYKIWKKIF